MQVNATLESALRHFRENRLDAADKDLREILQSDPQNNSAKTLLAGIHFRRGRLAQAETLAQDVLNTEPNNVDALGMLALLSKLQHNPAQAKEYFERLLSLGQGSATLYNEIGQCCLEQRDFPAAGAAFMKAIEFDRTNGMSYYNLGLALKMAGNSLETFSTFKRAIQIDPSLQDAYIQLWQQM